MKTYYTATMRQYMAQAQRAAEMMSEMIATSKERILLDYEAQGIPRDRVVFHQGEGACCDEITVEVLPPRPR